MAVDAHHRVDLVIDGMRHQRPEARFEDALGSRSSSGRGAKTTARTAVLLRWPIEWISASVSASRAGRGAAADARDADAAWMLAM